MLRARLPHGFLALAVCLPLVGTLGCANRGMEAPADVTATGAGSDGTAVATNAALALRPADLGATANTWLGRSQFTADPLFNGEIDDLRIYNSALTAGQITTIYNAH